MSAARHLVVGAALIALVTSCLSSLPDPITCPAAARFSAVTCPTSGPSPQPDQCLLPVGCYQTQGRTCQCTEECSPVPTKDSCNAPSKCPAGVRQPDAVCPPAEVHAANPAPCACGCVSCASVCDGFGPIIGPGPTGAISVNLVALPAQGRVVGILVRARGTADLHGAFTLDAPASPQSSARLESNDDFAEVLLAPEVPLAAGAPRTINVFSTAPIEVDCVVPYLLP
jgi:hypothetical protein